MNRIYFKQIAFLVIIMFMAMLHINAQTESSGIVAKGATPKLIAKQFKFTEGPAVDKAGNVYFTDQPNDKIWRYNIDGKLEVFMDKSGRANGLFFNKQGDLLACADEHNELWSISPQKKVTVLVTEFKGRKLNGPNDLWVDPKGGVYFTDPYYQRDYWTRKEPDIKEQRVYYLAKGKKEPVIAADNLVKPNGIIGTPDGKYLYVADIEANKTYKYEINSDGILMKASLFVEQGSDGMTIDNRGNVYLTGKGLSVYNAQGKKIEHIDIPENWTANVCFGGKKKDKLFITASEAIYELHMNVQGY